MSDINQTIADVLEVYRYKCNAADRHTAALEDDLERREWEAKTAKDAVVRERGRAQRIEEDRDRLKAKVEKLGNVIESLRSELADAREQATTAREEDRA